MSGMWVAVIVTLWVVVLGLVVVVTGVLRRIAVVLERQPATSVAPGMPSGPAPGSRLPDLLVAEKGGRALGLSQVPGPFVMAILTSTCSPCLTVADWVRGNRDRISGTSRKLLVLTDAEGRDRLALDSIVTVLTDDRDDVISTPDLPGTPFVLEVGADGTVQHSSVLGSSDRLVGMLEREDESGREVINVELVG